MKENRSITKKNLLGSFLGGSCGILALGYIHPAFLPVGVLVGVVLGWWYEAIYNSIFDNIIKGVEFGKSCRVFIGDCAQNSLSVLLRTKINIRNSFPVFTYGILIFAWLVSRPVACYVWLTEHPMNRAYVLRALMVIVQLLCCVLMASYLVFWLMPETMGGVDDVYGRVIPITPTKTFDYIIVICFGSVFLSISPIASLFANFGEGSKSFYQDYERYTEKGAIGYFSYHMGRSLVMQFKVYAFLLLGLVYFLGIGSLFVSILVVPLTIFIWTIREVNQIVMRQGHWICLGATMTTTVVAAWIFHSYFDNKLILWGVTLGTGMVSGILTEAVRRAILWVFKNTLVGRQYSNAKPGAFLKNRLAPAQDLIMRGWDNHIAKPFSP